VSSPSAEDPSPAAFHAYPWWSPRFWHGMPLEVWLPLVAEHRLRVAPHRWGLLATVSLAAAVNSLAGRLSDGRFRRALANPPPTPPPLFIVGHWRSGTTLLHELAMLDDRFCCPSTYQCFAPGHFLLTERFFTRGLNWLMPAKRPMDEVALGWDRPQEDEFALVNLGAPSPYRRIAFPATSGDRPRALDVSRLPPAELERWRAALRRFLALLAVRDPRRPVLKSPPHTARVGELARMFPGARFLHVVRDPFVVLPSTLRLWRALHGVQALQRARDEDIERYAFAAFEEVDAAFERDRAGLAPGRLHELRYEDLVADPVPRLREAYERLDLGDFERVRPALERQVGSIARYRRNTYRHDPRLHAEIARRCAAAIARHGYAAPAADRPPAA